MIVRPDTLRTSRHYRGCQSGTVGKRTYETKRDAKNALKSHMALHGGEPLDIYRCEECNRFHLGHRGRP